MGAGKNHTPRIGVILAGGYARRMGADKPAVLLAGRRLIDHVMDRLAPQVDRILIAGPHGYDTSMAFTPDRGTGPRGPAAGLWAAGHWLLEQAPGAAGFVTAPVDAPFLPSDLYEKLTAGDGCAIASSEDGVHPTFAFWRAPILLEKLRSASSEKGLALHALAEQCSARRIEFSQRNCLLNINSPEELASAEALMLASDLTPEEK
ncbi:MAG: molybdenum cofactor guanylyltransferase [Alphaproteobacteria bacterium]|nr:molybdenum cofactor guanylyltransferase [Alphaproteobacteria bacterium]